MVANLSSMLAGLTGVMPRLGAGLSLVLAGRILAGAQATSRTSAETLQILRESAWEEVQGIDSHPLWK